MTTSNPFQPLWSPPSDLVRSCAMTRLIEQLGAQGISGVHDYESLHQWSVREPIRFWQLLFDFVAITAEGARVPVYDSAEGPTPLAKRWFPQVQLNFAENLLRGHDSRTALVSWSENRRRRSISLGELRAAAGGVQAHLQSIGVRSTDRIFAYMPNIPEAVVCLAAVASLGAAWASCGTDYQLQGLLSRAQRVMPRVLVAARSYIFRGEEVDLTAAICSLVAQIPSVEHVILVDYLSPDSDVVLDLRPGVGTSLYSKLVETPRSFDTSQRFPFSQPLYLMFSSGTTGTPKGIVHSAGGTLLEHKKEQMLHGDVRSGDRVFYQTSTSWMMWNWVVSALASEATVVMFDGDPLAENGMILWRMAQDEGVTHFGTSAAFLGALERQGRRPATQYALPDLRVLMSTGSTLYPAQFDYIMESIKPLWIQSISGGTDIIGCFGLGSPLKPVVRGEVQSKSLGYDVQVYSVDGQRVVGEEGELVCCSPAPSMPVFFLDDPNGEQYRAAYFSEFPSVWRHGDLVRETPEGGLVFLGRSDATLKPSGVRVATADIYSALQVLTRIKQGLAVGYTPSHSASERIVLFVVLAAEDTLDDALTKEIVRILKASNSFYAPALVVQAPDVPRTTNNKLSELSVKRILRGDDPGNRSALANPECLDFYEHEARERVRLALDA